MVDNIMIEQGPKSSSPPQVIEARSLLSQVMETRMLPIERLKAQPKGEAVDIQRIGDTTAVLEKVDDHYEVAVFDGKGVMIEIPLDPTSHEITKGLQYVNTKRRGNGNDVSVQIKNLEFSPAEVETIKSAWYSKAVEVFNRNPQHVQGGYVNEHDVMSEPKFFLPAGEWRMAVHAAKTSGETEYKPVFIFYLGEGKGSKAYYLYPNERKKDNVSLQGNLNEVNVSDSLTLTKESTIFRIANKTGKEIVSYSGTEPVVDPSSPNDLYFIQTGQVYKLDLASVGDRTSKPVVEQQIKVEGPRKILFDPN